jgi:hypothetical protein
VKAIRELLKDRRRSQQGSMLSGVLIIVAFLAVISGALMTELSTNFLLSNALSNRVQTQATVNSAVELALNQLQVTHLNQPCPATVSTPPLNSQTAVASVKTCYPNVYEPIKFSSLRSASQAFMINGGHTQVAGLDDYVVGNPDGTLFDYPFGSVSTRWTLPIGGAITGPTLVMADPTSRRPGRQYLVVPSDCPGPTHCLSVFSDDGSTSRPARVCSIPTSDGPVTTLPATSPNYPGLVFYADGRRLDATDVTRYTGDGDGDSTCRPVDSVQSSQPIVAGPIAFDCLSSCGQAADEVYAVVSDASSSYLNRYIYGNGNLAFVGPPLLLPWGSAVGITASGPNLPTNLVITFQNGGVASVPVAMSGKFGVMASASVPGRVGDAPYWCTLCGNLIGVGTSTGLYLLNSALITYAAPPVGSPYISTVPMADNAGNWYFGADDGYVYVAQAQTGQVTTRTRFGPMSQIGSSVQVDDCNNSTWICVYAGGLNHNAYLIPLDAHDAVVTACIGTVATGCADTNPRLWTRVEIGVASDPRAVHIQGWSYFAGP